MTEAELNIVRGLALCSFLPASWDKRFCRDMAATAANKPSHELSEYQNANLLRLAYKYRRQLPTNLDELAFDEMERNADRRSAEGRGALPLFARPKPTPELKPSHINKPEPSLPLFEEPHGI